MPLTNSDYLLIVCLIIGFVYMVWELWAIWSFLLHTRQNLIQNRSLARDLNSEKKFIELAILIPFKNEREHLPALIQALSCQSDLNFELIFVNDASTDQGVELLEELKSFCPLPFRVIGNEGSGKKRAIDTGIKNCLAPWVLLTDADCLPGHRWIESVKKQVASADFDLLLFPVLMTADNGFFAQMQKSDFYGLFLFTYAYAHKPIMGNAANLLLKKSAYLSHKPFDNNYHIPTGDDVFMIQSFTKRGLALRAVFDSDLLVSSSVEKGVLSFLRQRIRWGSKAAWYTDHRIKALSWVVFMANLLPWILIFIRPGDRWAISMLGLKFFIDCMAVYIVHFRVGDSRGYALVLPAMIFHSVYVPFSAIIGLLNQVFRAKSEEISH